MMDQAGRLKAFVVSTEELLSGMEQALVTLENQPDDEELLAELFRGAHRIKGDAAIVGLNPIAEFVHVLEELLDKIRAETVPLNGEMISVMLGMIDAVRKLFPSTEKAAETRGAASAAAPAAEKATSIRVTTEKLDQMLNLIGELAISRNRVGRMLADPEYHSDPEALNETYHESDRLYVDLQTLVMQARMVPLSQIFRPQARTVRDFAKKLGKQVALELDGEEVEVDTRVVEQLRDPLLHMVRNALDHGIEGPEDRKAKGKDPCGVIKLRAYHESGQVVIQVIDDGRGLDRARIAERAAKLGLAAQPDSLPDSALFDLIFAPGFSTAETVTELSGRGVGMDIVRSNVESLRGTISVESRSGRGCTITARLPLTLAIIQGFGVGTAGETYVLPLDAVSECLELPDDAAQTRAETGIINLRGSVLPYMRLRQFLGLQSGDSDRENIVVVAQGEQRVGVVVDVLHGECQAVIKPLPRRFQELPGIAGSTILADGRVGFILDVQDLIKKRLLTEEKGDAA